MNNLVEITKDEQILINGGESGWYWLVFGLRVGIEYLNEEGKGGRMHSAG